MSKPTYPWRKVISYHVEPDSRGQLAWQRLDCGHMTEIFTGKKALAAKHNKGRVCKKCPPIHRDTPIEISQ